MKTIVTFGEIMGRLCPDGFLRFPQAMPGKLEMTFAGAEANVAVSVVYLGGVAKFISALPDNGIADACLANLRSYGVDVSGVLKRPGRLGLYFVETGANQRPSRVIYDREYSSIAQTPADAYDWGAAFKGAGWLHLSGITAALSEKAAEGCIFASSEAKKAGLQVSCDLNFRKKLWQWKSGVKPNILASETMSKILPYVDVVIANEEDAADVLGIHAEDSDVEKGKLNTSRYPDVARQICDKFPNVSQVAITLRESISASHNNWAAMLYSRNQDKAFFAPVDVEGVCDPYPIRNIVDRVGGGDSFAAGLIFALNTPEFSQPEVAIRFATAASCLAHSIRGDFNLNTREEVELLMKGSASGRVVR